MVSQSSEVAIVARCVLGILVALALTLGLGGVVVAQVNQTFASVPLEPRSPSGKRGVVIVESGAPELLDQCLAQCDPVSSPVLAHQSGDGSTTPGS